MSNVATPYVRRSHVRPSAGPRSAGVFVAIASILLGLLTACGNDNESGSLQRLNVGINQGGAYRVYQETLIGIWNRELEQDFTGVVVSGAIEGFNLIDSGQLHVSTWTPDLALRAQQGTGEFEGKPIWIPPLYAYNYFEQSIIVREDSGIKTLRDLDGKKFNAGVRGTPSELMVRQALEAIGITPEYFDASLEDAVNAVKDNRIVGYSKSGSGFGLDPTAKEIMSDTPLVVLGFTQDEMNKVQEKYPHIRFRTVPANALYEGSPEHTSIVGIVGIALSPEVPAEIGSAMLKAMMDNRAELEAAFAGIIGKDPIELTLQESSVPLHMGTVEYLRENNIQVPEHLLPPS